MLLLLVLLAAGCGEREFKLEEVKRYHEEMDGPDADVLLLTEQVRRWADDIAQLEPEIVGREAPGLLSQALIYQEKAYEFGEFFASARYETENIAEFLQFKIEVLASLQADLQSFMDDFLKVYRFSSEDEEALPGYHSEWIALACKNFTEAVEKVEGEFTRGRRVLLSEFILMGDR
ncbi:MAG: hypothetical protein A2Y64_00545 [Candidatus Coatesbacteria bacterium RBG_13_66_14]|uniref:Imelysin-like domain-containing protein n=1 Tax=Candidatus Coatesbacteria bacterium RBG_13_66_14 TaxID=1817816 RepID=A0A1F5EY55_9BACT|nr:MAG: hypothetical protein A2Y64_00545 [Candidatus Coatesbacteria bacterium RBG_13_66_14]